MSAAGVQEEAMSLFANAPPLTPLQEDCFHLLQTKQYKSCEIVARFDLSKAETGEVEK